MNIRGSLLTNGAEWYLKRKPKIFLNSLNGMNLWPIIFLEGSGSR
jgi:hypothetical protein